MASYFAWLDKIPIWATPTSAWNSSKSRLPFTFINWCRKDSKFEKCCVEIIFIDHQTCPKPCCSWGPLSNVQFPPGNRQRRPFCVMRRSAQYSKYGYITHQGIYCLHAKYHHTHVGYTVVMSIWNVDVHQRQSWLTWAKSCYIMSVSNKLSYLLVSIMLLSQDWGTIIFTVKFKINNIAFTIKDSFKGQSNWNVD